MKQVFRLGLVAALIALLNACSSTRTHHSHAPPTLDPLLVGHWRSIDIAETNPAPRVKAVSYSFEARGRFSTIYHMEDGKQVKTRGTYVTEPGVITLALGHNNTVRKAYNFKNGLLELRDADDAFSITFQQRLPVPAGEIKDRSWDEASATLQLLGTILGKIAGGWSGPK